MASPINKKFQLAYVPKIWATVVYFILLLGNGLLFLGRHKEAWRSEFLLEKFPDYHTHISNFSITMIIILVVGYIEVLVAQRLKGTYIVALLAIVANLVYELFIPFINTPDILDAYYGIAGAILVFLFLIPYEKKDLQKNPQYTSS